FSSLVISRITRPPVRSRNSSTSSAVNSSVRRPNAALTTRRCSGSKATWSQQSPRQASPGAARSPCVSCLPTTDHCSSNWTSVVLGGKSRELVVELPGVLAGLQGQPDDGVLIDAGQPRRLADAAALGEVGQGGDGLVRGQA